jgi:hypothetical protein
MTASSRIADAGVKRKRGRALFTAAKFGRDREKTAGFRDAVDTVPPPSLPLIDLRGSLAGLTLAWPPVPTLLPALACARSLL